MPVQNLIVIEQTSYYVKIGWTANYTFGFEGVTFNADGLYFLETIPKTFDIYKKGPSDGSFNLIASNLLGNIYIDKNFDFCQSEYYIVNHWNSNDKTNTLVVQNKPSTYNIALNYGFVQGNLFLEWNVSTNADFMENSLILNEQKLAFHFTDYPIKLYRKICEESSYTLIAEFYSSNQYVYGIVASRTSYEFYVETTICGSTYTSNVIALDNCSDIKTFVLNTPFLTDVGIQLSWINVYANEYKIYHRVHGDTVWGLVHTTTDLYWIDNEASRDIDYDYYAEALYDCCPMLTSNTKTIKSLCKKQINNFIIESATARGVYLRWDRPYDNTEFEIFRKIGVGSYTSLGTTFDSRYIDKSLPTLNTNYTYYIKTVGYYGGCGIIQSSELTININCNFTMFLQRDTSYTNMEKIRFSWGGQYDKTIKPIYDSYLVNKKDVILYNPQYDYKVEYKIYARKLQPVYQSTPTLLTTSYSTVFTKNDVEINCVWEFSVMVDVTGCGELLVGKFEHCTGGPPETITPGAVTCGTAYLMNLRAVYNQGMFTDSIYISWNHLPTNDITKRYYRIERRRKIAGGYTVWEQIYNGSENTYVDNTIEDFSNYQYRGYAVYYNFWEYVSEIENIQTEQCPSTPTNWCFRFSKDPQGNAIIFWDSPDPKGTDYDVYWVYYEQDNDLVLLGTTTGVNKSFQIGQLDHHKVHLEAITRNMCNFETDCVWIDPPIPPLPPPNPCDHTCPAAPSYWCFNINENIQTITWEQPIVGGTFKKLNSDGQCIDITRTFSYVVRHFDIPPNDFYYNTTERTFNYSILIPENYGLNAIDPERFYIHTQTNDECYYTTNCTFSPDPVCNDNNACYHCNCCGYSKAYWDKKFPGQPCELTIPNPLMNVVQYNVYKDGVFIETITDPKYVIPD
jgi:hypothetical protein